MSTKSAARPNEPKPSKLYITDPTLFAVAHAKTLISVLRKADKKMGRALTKKSKLEKSLSPAEIRAYRLNKVDGAINLLRPFLVGIVSDTAEKKMVRAKIAYANMLRKIVGNGKTW